MQQTGQKSTKHTYGMQGYSCNVCYLQNVPLEHKAKKSVCFFCGVRLPGVVGENTNNGGTGAVFLRVLSFVDDNTKQRRRQCGRYRSSDRSVKKSGVEFAIRVYHQSQNRQWFWHAAPHRGALWVANHD